MDKRFGADTRGAFEKSTGLGPNDYWDESGPGGSVAEFHPLGVEYAVHHGASIFGWQAHGDTCGGLPGKTDSDIQKLLDTNIQIFRKRYPGRHFRIFITESGITAEEIK